MNQATSRITRYLTSPVMLAFMLCMFGLLSCSTFDPDPAHSSYRTQSFQPADSLFAKLLYDEAEREYRRALSSIDSILNPAAEAYLQFRVGKSLVRMRRFTEAKPHFEAAIPFYRKIKDPYGLTECLYSYGFVCNEQGDHKSAIRITEECLRLLNITGNQPMESDALNNVGSFYLAEGRADKAEEYFRRGVDLANKRQDLQGEIRAIAQLANARNEQGDLPGALNASLEALVVSRNSGNRSYEANVLVDLASRYSALDSTQKGVECLKTALPIKKELEDWGGAIDVLGNLRQLYSDGNQYREAIQAAEDAVSLALKIGDTTQSSKLLNGLGDLYFQEENIFNAMECYRQSAEIASRIDDLQEQGKALCSIGIGYIWLNDLVNAEEYVEKSLHIGHAAKDDAGIGASLLKLGAIHVDLNEFEKAKEDFAESMKFLEAARDTQDICEALWKTGELYGKLGDRGVANDYYQRALKLSRNIKDTAREAWVLYLLGSSSFAVADYHEAFDYVDQALRVSQSSELPEELKKYLFVLEGECLMRQDQPEKALESFKKALATTEGVRRLLEYDRNKRTYLESVAKLFDDVILCLLELNRPSEAFEYVQRAKARAFLDLLAGGGFARSRDDRITPLSAGSDSVALEPDGSYAALKSQTACPLNLAEVRQRLGQGVTLLEYYQTADELLLWVVETGKVRFYRMNLPDTELHGLIREFEQSTAILSDQDALLSAFYQKLIGTVLDSVASDQLIIAPHGWLHELPFQVLRRPDGRYLGEVKTISYLASGSVLQYLQKRSCRGPQSLLGLGNPTLPDADQPSLKFAEKSVLQLHNQLPGSKALVGADASETAFRRLSGQYDLIYLACHSEFNAASPLKSCVRLAADANNDGRLEVEEIFNLKLKAGLVVLSSCESGLGELNGGDDLMGLSRAFMFAGAPSVVASLWPVEEKSTVYFMGKFCERLRDHSKAEALRLAQEDTRREFAHPFYWAPFILIGDWS